MRAIVLLGVIYGALYASGIWLAVEHIERGSVWNLLLLPLVLGGIALFLLIGWTLLDAIEGGVPQRDD